MAKRAKVDGLPEEVKRWLERALADNGFSQYEQLEALLGEKGFAISKSAIHRYGQKIQRRFAAIKASTEAARIITEGAADDPDARSEAVIALVQTEIFEALIALQEVSGEDGEEPMDPATRLGLVSTAAKNIATLSRASVAVKQYRATVQQRAAEVAEKAEKLATKGGLSADAVAEIRRSILGIAG